MRFCDRDPILRGRTDVAESLLSRLRINLMASANALVSQVEDAQSVEVQKQRVRDLENNIDAFKKLMAEQSAECRLLGQELKAKNARAEYLRNFIDAILNDGNDANDDLALDPQIELTELTAEGTGGIALAQADFNSANGAFSQLSVLLGQVTASHRKANQTLERMERTERMASAKENAASVLTEAAKLAGSAQSSSVDDSARRLRKREMVADEMLKQATQDAGAVVSNDESRMMAEAALRKRRDELSQTKAQTASAA